jgi:hypothetical protein
MVLAACGGSSGTAASSSTNPPTTSGTSSTHLDKPAGNTPSVSAKMICEKEAEDDIYNSATGVKTVAAFKPTWTDHVYSCDYVYPGGAVMKLSVKELSTPEETTAYYDSLATKFGKAQDQPGLGQGAFTTKDGSLVVRKDYKVLYIDVSKLPASFGVPPDTRTHVAINVGATIMGCWTGA